MSVKILKFILISFGCYIFIDPKSTLAVVIGAIAITLYVGLYLLNRKASNDAFDYERAMTMLRPFLARNHLYRNAPGKVEARLKPRVREINIFYKKLITLNYPRSEFMGLLSLLCYGSNKMCRKCGCFIIKDISRKGNSNLNHWAAFLTQPHKIYGEDNLCLKGCQQCYEAGIPTDYVPLLSEVGKFFYMTSKFRF